MDYKDRIKHLKSEKKITNEQLARMTGIPLGTLSKILAGISDSPKLSNMMSICDALDCTLDYIVYGIQPNNNNYSLNPEEITLIENYRLLDSFGRELSDLVVRKECERVRAVSAAPMIDAKDYRHIIPTRPDPIGHHARKTTHTLNGRRKLSLYDMPVSAGTGIYLDESRAETIDIVDNYKTQKADFALRISGNSMEPRYSSEEILLVEKCSSVEKGELGIFILDGCGYFKVYMGDRLMSLNSDYHDIMLKDFQEVICVGRVVGKLKKK